MQADNDAGPESCFRVRSGHGGTYGEQFDDLEIHTYRKEEEITTYQQKRLILAAGPSCHRANYVVPRVTFCVDWLCVTNRGPKQA